MTLVCSGLACSLLAGAMPMQAPRLPVAALLGSQGRLRVTFPLFQACPLVRVVGMPMMALLEL